MGKTNYQKGKIILYLLMLLFAVPAFAVKVDTVAVYSKSMKKNIKTVVVLPQDYESGKDFSTLYLLHGYGGYYSNWLDRVPKVKDLADQYQCIIVMPDGSKNSWYWNSPIDKKSQYETFVSSELINFVDENYKTKKDRKHRAITGLSMGGQGALFLAFRHQDVFGAAGSMSGGLDIRAFPLSWEMKDKLGEYAKNRHLWDEYTVINQIYRLTPDNLQIIIDCGVSDFFYQVNKKMHKKLLYYNIPHVYIERPGGHSWEVWSDAIEYQMVFFNQYFQKHKK